MTTTQTTYTEARRHRLTAICGWLISEGHATTVIEAAALLDGPAGVWFEEQAERAISA